MDSTKLRSKGFTLIATLLLLLLLSGIAIGMLMMVSTEAKVGTHDVQNNTTFHAAEGAIEKMTSDLAATFQNVEAPTVSQITSLSALQPANTVALKYPVYTLTPATAGGALAANYGQIASGPYQGLSAQLLPVTLQATAQGPLGDEVNMSRTVQVALIPVFQFGIYSDSDLSFFAGVNLDFNGRVHTNGDLYLAAGDGVSVTFHDKVTSWGNVIRWAMPNGTLNANTGHNGAVNILTTPQGCDGANPPVTTCRPMLPAEDSVTVGAAPNTWTTGGQNAGWPAISAGSANYNSWVIDGNIGLKGGTGAKQLSLPFVNGTNGLANSPQPFEIVRRPPAGELSTSLLGAARLYNEASVRVLLVDDPKELPGGANDANNIRLANYKDPDNGLDYSHGVVASVPAGLPALGGGRNYTTYFATANSGIADPSNWNNAAVAVQSAWLTGPLYPPPVNTLYDPSGANQAPYMVLDNKNWNAVKAAPLALNLDLCNPSGPVSVPPAAGPPICDPGGAGEYPFYSLDPYPTVTLPYPTVPANKASTWNLLDGYLRVEYRDVNGVYQPVTQEWLSLGFARGSLPPTAIGANPVNPNAILLLQEPADRNRDGVLDFKGAPPGYTSKCTKKVGGVCTIMTYTPFPGTPPEVTNDGFVNSPWYGDSTQAAGSQSPSQYNWYPINFYDAREGEARDVRTGDQTCAPIGVMNAVEIDVGNLQQWLAGKTGTKGGSVDFATQNGYVLYFSDRRGMMINPNGTQVDPANSKTGDSGFEDVVNLGSQVGTPDGALQAIQAGKVQSAEDANNNTKLEAFGGANLGLGLGYVPPPSIVPGTAYTANKQVNSLINAGAADDPYLTVAGRIQPTCWIAQSNWVSGARHVLRLVDGTLGNLPVRPDLAFPNWGGFTVGSENPVYIYGDYNSNPADPIWGGGADVPHAAAGVIADAVTVLSNNWSDWASLNSPSNDGGRPATTTYYRTAVASGKNINFSVQGLAWAVGDFGTDGGLHNFLRLLENWGGQTLNYNGSMVSMYYSTYATGTDKNGGGTVYEPPRRNYTFDADFQQPQNLPPGTPMFRDIDNLSYRQSFSPCAAVVNGVCTN